MSVVWKGWEKLIKVKRPEDWKDVEVKKHSQTPYLIISYIVEIGLAHGGWTRITLVSISLISFIFDRLEAYHAHTYFSFSIYLDTNFKLTFLFHFSFENKSKF